MKQTNLTDKCPLCGNACNIEEFKHSESGRTIQAMWCSKCSADFARYRGERWRLIYQPSNDDD